MLIAPDCALIDTIEKLPNKIVGAISSNEKISRASRTKILWDNPTKAFGLGA